MGECAFAFPLGISSSPVPRAIPHRSGFPKAGVLLPPLGAGNKGLAQHGKHCHGALEEASVWKAQGGHLLILVMPFTW